MKRILHIIGKMDRAGAETMLMNLYRAIDRHQIQFDFVVFTDKKGHYDDEIIALGGRVIPILATNNWQRMRGLVSFLGSHPEYDVVHCHMLLNSMFPLLAAKKAGVKMRIAHSHNTENRKYGLKAKLYERLAKWTIAQTATHKIACGEAASAYLFPGAKDVWILLNGVDLEDLVHKQSKLTSRQFSHLGQKIIQVGRLSEVKNPFFTIEIAQELKKQNINAKIYLIGQGDLESDIQKRIEQLNLQNQIETMGVRSDVPDLMAEADLLLMPSFHEGFPVVLVESQAIGLPALVSTKVSKEVDLGVDLIQFLTINSAQDWIEKIKRIDSFKRLSSDERFDRLTEAGLNVKMNAQKLTYLYCK